MYFVLHNTCTACVVIDSRTVSCEIGLIIRQTSKGNLRHRTCYEIAALVSSLTSTLDVGAMPRDRDPLPAVFKAEWAPGPAWTVAEVFASTGIRSPHCPVRSKSGLIINVVNTARWFFVYAPCQGRPAVLRSKIPQQLRVRIWKRISK